MRAARPWLVAAALAAGCASDLEPLPQQPGPVQRPPEAPPQHPPPVGAAPVAEPPGPATPPPGATGDLLQPSRGGDAIHEGVILLDPALDATGTATFRVRNDRAEDLPDLILAVVFAVPATRGRMLTARIETVEAPLGRGESRAFEVRLPRAEEDPAPTGFRVVAGLPEVLAAPAEGRRGTTFLGGLLECAELDADLTGPDRRVIVGLADRPAAAGAVPLPPLEGQLLLARSGGLVWTGPWIVLPRGDPEGGRVRRVRWNLPDVPGLPGSTIYLRIRERR
jgi:hypothetical protein